jgi:PhnB protein
MTGSTAASSQTPSTIAPSLVVTSGVQAIAFYQEAFGAVELYRVPDGGVAQLSIEGAPFWLAGEGPELHRFTPAVLGGRSVWMILTVADPDALWARAVAAGATPEHPVADSHGWRMGTVVDPYGHRWEIGRPLGIWPPP